MPATSPTALKHKRQRAYARLKERFKEDSCFKTNYYRKQSEYRKGKRPIATMLNSARSRAKEKGLLFTLEKADIVVPAVCPILGIPLRCAEGRKERHADNSPSLDRKDNVLGYTKENVWVISYRANRLKSDATLEELRLLVAALEARS